MVVAEGGAEGGERALRGVLGLGLEKLELKHGEIGEHLGRLGVATAVDLLGDAKGALDQRLGFDVSALPGEDDPEVGQPGGEAGVLEAQRLLLEGEGLSDQGLSFPALTLVLQHAGKVVQRGAIPRVVFAQRLLLEDEDLSQ